MGETRLRRSIFFFFGHTSSRHTCTSYTNDMHMHYDASVMHRECVCVCIIMSIVHARPYDRYESVQAITKITSYSYTLCLYCILRIVGLEVRALLLLFARSSLYILCMLCIVVDVISQSIKYGLPRMFTRLHCPGDSYIAVLSTY